jgi:hypothetical protein
MMVVDVAENVSWKYQFKFMSFGVITLVTLSCSMKPMEKNCSRPINPYCGTSPYAKPQPSIHHAIAAMQASNKFFSSTDETNPVRQHPASSIAKPACMNMIRADARMIHECVIAASIPSNRRSSAASSHVVSCKRRRLLSSASCSSERASSWATWAVSWAI